ncbi:ribonuclease P protein component [Oceanibium sediminis]|uniref:ribonuclease P protein component n=1 Tax=Oceanibium sediminis TaxID=2026339 RepID=UPI000DD41DC2|nr:ribonuclease P protein component [Oceanibium sediminis]
MAPPDPTRLPLTGSADAGPAVPSLVRSLPVLKKRADFLAAARGRKQVRAGFILQARERGDGAPVVRIGYTCSKKVGNAVARNRAKRRLREAARAVLREQGRAGWDYVLIGRQDVTASLPFTQLTADLSSAVTAIHKPRA